MRSQFRGAICWLGGLLIELGQEPEAQASNFCSFSEMVNMLHVRDLGLHSSGVLLFSRHSFSLTTMGISITVSIVWVLIKLPSSQIILHCLPLDSIFCPISTLILGLDKYLPFPSHLCWKISQFISIAFFLYTFSLKDKNHFVMNIIHKQCLLQ